MKDFGKYFWQEYKRVDVPRQAAALSYYATFSLTPLLILVLVLGSIFVSSKELSYDLALFFSSLFGLQSLPIVESIIKASTLTQGQNIFLIVFLLLIIIYAASRAFTHLAKVFSEIYHHGGDSNAGPGLVSVSSILTNHILAIVYMAGLFVLGSFFIILSLLSSFFLGFFNEIFSSSILNQPLNFLFQLIILMIVFSLFYKVSSRGVFSWYLSFISALIASILLLFLNLIFFIYFENSIFSSVYHAFGFIVLFLFWVYYASQSLFIGAIFSKSLKIKKTLE